MSKIKRLLNNYDSHIAVPWRDAAAAQRVIFCVYPQSDELRLRYHLAEFELTTQRRNHRWLHIDLTDSFASWLTQQRYADKYFNKPELLNSLLPQYADYLQKYIQTILDGAASDANTVVALSGVGTLFGLIKVKDLVDSVAPSVPGRLLVFFPGRYEDNNNFRLLDGYDGWNYHAFVITPDKEL